ncbi:MAG: peptide chain release factor N(5)-glutamine methyltransferase [Polyangiaceae bacterium]|nr:peptide chain release factor N(5)-glutamine methyltransferase [Polyangiaceae bacterium]
MTRAAPSAAREPWSIGRVAAWAQEDFRARGFDSPRLDAELVIAHALGVDRIRLILERDRPLSPAELAGVRELIKRRRGGEPVSYILGSREFYGLPFRVAPAVLIPRADTETLVEVALAATRARSMHGALLDLCTGSGCVAIAFARQRRTWRVTGADIEEAALEVARHNALRLGVLPNVDFVQGDLFDAVASPRRFDAIVGNPPYIPSTLVEQLDPGIRDFEPRIALDGGADGLDIVRRIVSGAAERLTPGGSLALELHYDQAERVSALLAAAGFGEIAVHRDHAGHQRVVSAKQGHGAA